MKIINEEDGKKKIYVQLNDLALLLEFGSAIPAITMERVYGDCLIVIDSNRFDFKEFDDEESIEFFENCEWIPDFRYYKNMSMEEIIADGQRMASKMNEIALKWNSLSEKKKSENESLLTEYEKLKHKMHSCAEILFTKQGHRVMPFPIVPDYEGFKVCNEDCEYVAQQGLNPLQILYFRKDGKSFDSKREKLPLGLVQSAESILISDNLEHNEFFENVSNSRSLSEDNKYLVTTFKISPKIEEEKTITRDSEKTYSNEEKPRTLSKRIKDWYNNRKKR